MKKQVFFIHGGDSFSKLEDFRVALKTMSIRNLPGSETTLRWQSNLAAELGLDYEVFTPRMPNGQNAHYEEWKIWFERHFEYLHDGVILVGHSLGGMFLAKYLSEKTVPFEISAIFLLAAPCGFYEDETGNDCGSFCFQPENLTKLAEYGDKVELWHSEDDTNVPFEHVTSFHKFLPAAKLMTFTDKNHFILSEFPELIESIRLK